MGSRGTFGSGCMPSRQCSAFFHSAFHSYALANTIAFWYIAISMYM